jgi:hypothetical protein
MRKKQLGLSLSSLVFWGAILGFTGLMAAKLMPAYLEWMSVKKIFAAMEGAGETKGTVGEIRRTYEKRNAIENVTSVRGDDLEITKEGGEATISASWAVRVPMVYNINACIDFTASTSGGSNVGKIQ